MHWLLFLGYSIIKKNDFCDITEILLMVWFGFMVLNATFNNISVISWWSYFIGGGTGVPRENHRPVASNRQTLSHNVSSTPCLNGVRTHNVSGDRH